MILLAGPEKSKRGSLSVVAHRVEFSEMLTVFIEYCKWLSGKEICLPVQETQEMWVRSLGWKDPLEEEMATYSSILVWKNPMDWGAWQATGHRFRHGWARPHASVWNLLPGAEKTGQLPALLPEMDSLVEEDETVCAEEWVRSECWTLVTNSPLYLLTHTGQGKASACPFDYKDMASHLQI